MNKLKSIFAANKNMAVTVLAASLIASLSFGLGYLIAKEEAPAPIIIEKSSP